MNRNEPLNRGKKKNIDSENIQAQKTGIIGSKHRKRDSNIRIQRNTENREGNKDE